MSFDSNFPESTILAKLGKDLIFTGSVGEVTARGVIDHDVDLVPTGYESSIREHQNSARMMVAEVGEPKRGDTITDTETAISYTVDSVIVNDGNIVTVAIR